MLKVDKLISFMLTVLVLVIYSLGLQPDISFWDSSEFSLAAYSLSNTHPPGAPLYVLMGSMLAGILPPEQLAYWLNFLSAIFGAVSCGVFYLLSLDFLKFIDSKTSVKWHRAAATIGTLTLAFTTSYWTAATETEVYTLSFLLFLLLIKIIWNWFTYPDLLTAPKYLSLFGLLMGLSLGVHLLNLALIIPLCVLIGIKQYGYHFKSVLVSLLLGTLVFFLLYQGVVLGGLELASKADKVLVNEWNLAVGSGLWILLIPVVLLILLSLSSRLRSRSAYRTFGRPFLLFFVGASIVLLPLALPVDGLSMTASLASPQQLKEHLSASQFGVDKIPLFKGPSYNAPLDPNRPFTNDKPWERYDRDRAQYVVLDDGSFQNPNFDPDFEMIFPRMYSDNPADIIGYQTWTEIKGKPIVHRTTMGTDTILKPTLTDNINFFLSYQSRWLYNRYLNWNFVGRQNNRKGDGTIFYGNWKSGISWLDSPRLGKKETVPEHVSEHSTNDHYFALPFLLGLIGLFGLRKKPALLLFTSLLFFIFGIGLILFVNPTPLSLQIRERDYIFLGSFIAYAFWISIGSLIVIRQLSRIIKSNLGPVIGGLILALLIPFQLLAKGLDDHDRSSDHFPLLLAKAYLDSCPENAILITNGDNFTFPLLYAQGVLEHRMDVTVINFDQLNNSNYVLMLKRQQTINNLSISLSDHFLMSRSERILPKRKEVDQAVELNRLLAFINDTTTRISWNGKKIHYFPNDSFFLETPPSAINHFDAMARELQAEQLPGLMWSLNESVYTRNQVVILDILNENFGRRPIAFVQNGAKDHYMGLENYLIGRGLVEVLAPLKPAQDRINPKMVMTRHSTSLIRSNLSSETTLYPSDELISYGQRILRPAYYFSAQAELELGKHEVALEIIEQAQEILPNNTVPYGNYSFSLGKLSYRAGDRKMGAEICQTSMTNLKNNLRWLISSAPEQVRINKRRGNFMMNSLEQMAEQLMPLDAKLAEREEEEIVALKKDYLRWLNSH